jgi:hypothetical protein
MPPVRHHLGITAFGTNACTAANAGDRLMPEHEEDEETRSCTSSCVAGHASRSRGETVDALEGTLVFVQPQTNRTAFVEEAGTTVLAIGSTVGQPYEAGAGRSGRSSILRTSPVTTKQ